MMVYTFNIFLVLIWILNFIYVTGVHLDLLAKVSQGIWFVSVCELRDYLIDLNVVVSF